MDTADANQFYLAIILALEVGGKVVFGQSLEDPIPVAPEGVLDHADAQLLQFQLGEGKKVTNTRSGEYGGCVINLIGLAAC